MKTLAHEKWLKENLGPRCLAPLTSTDRKALAAAVAIVELWAGDDHDSVIDAFGAIVLRMQPKNWFLAYHAIAMVRNWEDRTELWRLAGLGYHDFGRCKFEPQPLRSIAQAMEVVAQFNRDFPVGSHVILRRDSGEIDTRVRAPAELLSGHSPVAWFEGVSGAYSIEDNRVRLAEPASA